MKLDIARAWKDEAYRQSLSSEELAQLPENPAGELELNDAELDTVQGGRQQPFHNSGVFGNVCLYDQHNSGGCASYGSCQSVGNCSSFDHSTCFSNGGGSCFSNYANGSCNSARGLCISGGNSGCFNNLNF